jgi:hypothetical protein
MRGWIQTPVLPNQKNKKKKTNKEQNNKKETRKQLGMSVIKPIISIISLNVNNLNTVIKR